MTRVEAAPDFTLERHFQAHVIRLAYSAGWGMGVKAAINLDEELVALGQPAAPLDGLVFHPAIMYRSEPGWPDLTLFRLRDRRLIFAELKTDKPSSKVSPRQAKVHELLRAFTTRAVDVRRLRELGLDPDPDVLAAVVDAIVAPRIEVHVWRPSDLPAIEGILA